MSIAQPVYQRLRAAHSQLPDHAFTPLCAKAVTRLSQENLMTFPWIASRVAQGTLSLHAWYYDLEHVSLERLSDEP
jgi:carbonic anhydrase